MTSSFPDWLGGQTDRDDEVGQLARDVAAVDDFPDSGGRAIFDGYFASVTPAERDRFDRAWSEFDSEHPPSPTSDDPDGL